MAASAQGWSYRPAVTRITTVLTFAMAIYALFYGWSSRDAFYLSPAEGGGYALGILGGSLMLLLALYPVRKNVRWMRHFGAVRHWFRMHMFFGIAGPIAILYHCNFRLGATNSNVALGAMLIVASSGLFGRYLYSRIHHGLYGGAIRVADLRKEWQGFVAQMNDMQVNLESITEKMDRFEEPVLNPRRTFHSALLYALTARWQRRRIKSMANRQLKHAEHLSTQQQQGIQTLLERRLDAAFVIRRVRAFERFFDLWHLLHMPLFVLLILTGVAHVISVHLY